MGQVALGGATRQHGVARMLLAAKEFDATPEEEKLKLAAIAANAAFGDPEAKRVLKELHEFWDPQGYNPIFPELSTHEDALVNNDVWNLLKPGGAIHGVGDKFLTCEHVMGDDWSTVTLWRGPTGVLIEKFTRDGENAHPDIEEHLLTHINGNEITHPTGNVYDLAARAREFLLKGE